MARALPLLAAAFFLILASPAFADTALFDYQVDAKAQTDKGAPMLTLQAREFVKKGKVVFERSDGKSDHVKLGRMEPGQKKKIPFRQPKGTFKYKVTIKGDTQDGRSMSAVFDTTITWVDPIQLQVNRQKVLVGEGKLEIVSSRPIAKIEIEVFDNDGKQFVNTTQSMGGKKGALTVKWSPVKPEVSGIRLRAIDVDGFWAALLLEPFWVEINHSEVIFHFGKATWADTETPKLTATLKEIKTAVKRHKKKGLDMQLYIVGYTDTVGSHADNNKLSKSRARAIAKWFKKAGIKMPIYYQGLGESVLAKKTPDNTPEAVNRRALYILGNSPPPRSSQIPKGNWKKL